MCPKDAHKITSISCNLFILIPLFILIKEVEELDEIFENAILKTSGRGCVRPLKVSKWIGAFLMNVGLQVQPYLLQHSTVGL